MRRKVGKDTTSQMPHPHSPRVIQEYSPDTLGSSHTSWTSLIARSLANPLANNWISKEVRCIFVTSSRITSLLTR